MPQVIKEGLDPWEGGNGGKILFFFIAAFLDSSTLQLFFDLYHSIPPSFSPLVSPGFVFSLVLGFIWEISLEIQVLQVLLKCPSAAESFAASTGLDFP